MWRNRGFSLLRGVRNRSLRGRSNGRQRFGVVGVLEDFSCLCAGSDGYICEGHLDDEKDRQAVFLGSDSVREFAVCCSRFFNSYLC